MQLKNEIYIPLVPKDP